ncbi:uncharacterized protein [Amphiura filiformis]|uniref:uncharacterized protein n=1 Tax=Amphiura filiformis TaxID=82378 RepID=UPI003B21E69B
MVKNLQLVRRVRDAAINIMIHHCLLCILTLQSIIPVSSTTKCQNALGMYSRTITAEQMEASTHSNRVERARLNSTQAWRAHEDDMDPWFQIDLIEPVYVSGLSTQGNPRPNEVEYVMEYKIGYSYDGIQWQNITDEDGVDVIFPGHDAVTDRNKAILRQFSRPVNLRFITIYVILWEGTRCALRLELYGCDVLPTSTIPSPDSTSTTSPMSDLSSTITPILFTTDSRLSGTMGTATIASGYVAAIVIGVAVLLLVLLLVGIWQRKRRRREKKSARPGMQFVAEPYELTVEGKLISPTPRDIGKADINGTGVIYHEIKDVHKEEEHVYSEEKQAEEELVVIYATSPTVKNHTEVETMHTNEHIGRQKPQGYQNAANTYETVFPNKDEGDTEISANASNILNEYSNVKGGVDEDIPDKSDNAYEKPLANNDHNQILPSQQESHIDKASYDKENTHQDEADISTKSTHRYELVHPSNEMDDECSNNDHNQILPSQQESHIDKASYDKENTHQYEADISTKSAHRYEIVHPSDEVDNECANHGVKIFDDETSRRQSVSNTNSETNATGQDIGRQSSTEKAGWVENSIYTTDHNDEGWENNVIYGQEH